MPDHDNGFKGGFPKESAFARQWESPPVRSAPSPPVGGMARPRASKDETIVSNATLEQLNHTLGNLEAEDLNERAAQMVRECRDIVYSHLR